MSSPTARSLAFLRELGYTAQVAEYWHAFAKQRRDLFGIDIVALKPGEKVLVIQCTTGDHHAARRTKLQDHGFDKLWVLAGAQLEVWSWAKRGPQGGRKTWMVRREVL